MPFSSLVRTVSTAVLGAAVVFSAGAHAAPVPAKDQLDRIEPLPERLRGVDVREHLGDMVAKGATFIDEGGRHVSLADFLDGQHPVILTLNYSRCPMLCSLELNGLVGGMKGVDFTVGKDFRIVTVVLDPNEKPEEARASKSRYVRQYGRGEAERGWHFLTGSEANIRAVADSVGFSFGFNEARNEYVHPAAIILLSPQGKITRYLYGIEYNPKTLRLSLAESGEGKIGTSVDKLVLYCFHYDETEGRYAPVAMNIMRVGGGLTVALLGCFLTTYFISESRKKKKASSSSTSEGSARSATT
jgi:protein SCO1/2